MTLVAGSKSHPHAGFTLVELIVVLVIMAAMALLALVALPRQETAEEKAAFALADALSTLQDAALMQSQPTGLLVDGSQWRAVSYRNAEWVAIPSALIRQDNATPEITFAAVANDPFEYREESDNWRAFSLRDRGQAREDAPEPPAISFMPADPGSAFEVIITGTNETWTVSKSALGNIEVRRAQE